MSRLLRVELRRYRARRVALWVGIGLVGVVVLSTVVAGFDARPPSAAAIRQARVSYQQQAAQWATDGDQIVSDCLASQQADPNPDADHGCDQLAPTLDQFLPAVQHFFPPADPSSVTGASADGGSVDPAIRQVDTSMWRRFGGLAALDDLAPVFLFAVFLVAVSFVTAELASGAIGLWLTFVPGRTRVFWSKAGAAATWAVPLVVVAFALAAAGSYAAYSVVGTVGSAPDGVVGDIAAFTGRLAVAGAAVALAGVALGMLLRHAAAAIGVAAAWLGAETIFRWGMGDLQRWLFSVNLSAWLHGGEVYTTDRCVPSDTGMSCTTVEHLVTPVQGGLFLLGVTAVLSLAAYLVFRRRDVA